MVAELRLCSPHMVCHTLKHLEAEGFLRCAILLCEEVGIGYGVEVVGRHADMQVLGVLWQQAALYDVEVVGVDLGLVRAHRVLPSAQRCHYCLHLKVTSLHDTHLYRSASA